MSAPFSVSTVLNTTGIVHGFFGRQGGRSLGSVAANNMSVSQGDNPDLVVSNRSSAAYAIDRRGIGDLVVLKQVHSTTVVTLENRPDPASPKTGDAIVTNREDLLLGVLTADCAPVLLADPEAGIVAACHAGWRGAVGGIIGKTVEAMTAIGADKSAIRAAVGPTISAANYEIGPDTAQEIVDLSPSAAKHIATPYPGGREHFDLPGYVVEQLFDAGVGLVADLGLCTYAAPERYYSHRWATHHGVNTGRQIAIIGRRLHRP